MAKNGVFRNGWTVLVHLPSRTTVQVGVVGETGKRKGIHGSWVHVKIDGKWFLVPEKDVEPKTDEAYCVEFVKAVEQASLVRRMIKEVERTYIITPDSEGRGYLKALFGSGWKYQGMPVNIFWEKVLNETFERLTAPWRDDRCPKCGQTDLKKLVVCGDAVRCTTCGFEYEPSPRIEKREAASSGV